MNIGIVTDFYYPWIGGPAVLIRNLGHGLAARGHSVSLLAPSASGRSGAEWDGPMRVTRVRTSRSPVGHELRMALWPRPEIGLWMDRERFDVVHVHHPFPISATAIFEARRRRMPVVATNHTIPECSLWGIRGLSLVHSVVSTIFGRWIVMLMNRCDEVTTPTETAARALQALGYRRAVSPISNGVDTEQFSPGTPDFALRHKLGLDGRPVVLYTGRLDAEKQMDVWLRAAAELVKNSPVQFVVGGTGSERARLEELANNLGIGEHVRFIGYLDEAEFPKIYRLADVYFITSPVELQSISTLEAIASGLPVVAVNAGALPELVQDGRNGYLVPAGDAAAAAGALGRILDDSDIGASMSSASRDAALGHDLRESIRAYEQFLQRAADRSTGERHFERAPVTGG